MAEPAQQPSVGWDAFKTVISALVVIITALLGLIYNNLTSSISDIKIDVRKLTEDVSVIKENSAKTMTKLDDFIARLPPKAFK